MEKFADANGGTVRLSFSHHSFDRKPEHVLVICRFGEKWLLTNHKVRGWEFPGGKSESGESLEETARREVLEETGGVIENLVYLGEYEVKSVESDFVKAIFMGTVERLEKRENYLETNGPVLVDGDILSQRWAPQYSFIMKDHVIEKSLMKILEHR